ncbi:hypothetical protein [Candidatus Paracaedibacter symbiosus]|uniref:hypothetical protein n=1 Tax=Candidatus Paracaedibacter symbiosus TaxID=244582 RepID=UPI0012EC1A03|nr:hypothetical protein [Candidatus Paracaedibacter symbiosus]
MLAKKNTRLQAIRRADTKKPNRPNQWWGIDMAGDVTPCLKSGRWLAKVASLTPN